MKRNLISTLALISAAMLLTACGRNALPTTAYMAPAPIQIQQQAVPQELVVKFKPNVTRAAIDAFHSTYGTRTVKVLPGINVHVVALHPGVSQNNQLIQRVQRDQLVEFVEVNGRIELNPVITAKPIFSVATAVGYRDMLGQQMELKGLYLTSRSGAMIEVNGVRLSIVDTHGRVVHELPFIAPNSRIAVSGVIAPVQGFNLTENLGVRPLNVNALN